MNFLRIVLVGFLVACAADSSIDISTTTSAMSNEEDSQPDLRPLAHPATGSVIPEPPFEVVYDDVAEIQYRPALHPVALRRYRNSYGRRCRAVWCTTERLAYLAFLVSLITALSLVIYFRKLDVNFIFDFFRSYFALSLS